MMTEQVKTVAFDNIGKFNITLCLALMAGVAYAPWDQVRTVESATLELTHKQGLLAVSAVDSNSRIQVSEQYYQLCLAEGTKKGNVIGAIDALKNLQKQQADLASLQGDVQGLKAKLSYLKERATTTNILLILLMIPMFGLWGNALLIWYYTKRDEERLAHMKNVIEIKELEKKMIQLGIKMPNKPSALQALKPLFKKRNKVSEPTKKLEESEDALIQSSEGTNHDNEE